MLVSGLHSVLRALSSPPNESPPHPRPPTRFSPLWHSKTFSAVPAPPAPAGVCARTHARVGKGRGGGGDECLCQLLIKRRVVSDSRDVAATQTPTNPPGVPGEVPAITPQPPNEINPGSRPDEYQPPGRIAPPTRPTQDPEPTRPAECVPSGLLLYVLLSTILTLLTSYLLSYIHMYVLRHRFLTKITAFGYHEVRGRSAKHAAVNSLHVGRTVVWRPQSNSAC